jgi:hypothetical protein
MLCPTQTRADHTLAKLPNQYRNPAQCSQPPRPGTQPAATMLEPTTNREGLDALEPEDQVCPSRVSIVSRRAHLPVYVQHPHETFSQKPMSDGSCGCTSPQDESLAFRYPPFSPWDFATVRLSRFPAAVQTDLKAMSGVSGYMQTQVTKRRVR